MRSDGFSVRLLVQIKESSSGLYSRAQTKQEFTHLASKRFFLVTQIATGDTEMSYLSSSLCANVEDELTYYCVPFSRNQRVSNNSNRA